VRRENLSYIILHRWGAYPLFRKKEDPPPNPAESILWMVRSTNLNRNFINIIRSLIRCSLLSTDTVYKHWGLILKSIVDI